jgi:AraC-like DNA-binding protein
MNRIPLHKIHEKSPSGILLKHIRDSSITRDGKEILPDAGETHRDNYYLFLLLESGEAHLLIDFREYHVRGVAFGCILPGQVHSGMALNGVSGWIMCLDTLFVKDEWKEIFETVLISGNPVVVPDEGMLCDLRFCFSLLDRKIHSSNHPFVRHTVCALATSLAGIIAELYRQHQPATLNRRLTGITLRFKTLIVAHLKTVKSPAQYASLLNLSPAYLNEAVRKTTGFPAGYWIQDAVTLEAKRLLFYTAKSIKEIAFELGYDDPAYFTRLFTKLSGMSPTLFRANYHK